MKKMSDSPTGTKCTALILVYTTRVGYQSDQGQTRRPRRGYPIIQLDKSRRRHRHRRRRAPFMMSHTVNQYRLARQPSII